MNCHCVDEDYRLHTVLFRLVYQARDKVIATSWLRSNLRSAPETVPCRRHDESGLDILLASTSGVMVDKKSCCQLRQNFFSSSDVEPATGRVPRPPKFL